MYFQEIDLKAELDRFKRFHVGFTGTRHGMSQKQRQAFRFALDNIRLNLPDYGFTERPWFHHGDCVGADNEAANVAHDLGFFIVCHPPVSNELRAFNQWTGHFYEEETYFKRNRNIVNHSHLLFGTPIAFTDRQAGGTWYTISYSIKRDCDTYVVDREGNVACGNDDPNFDYLIQPPEFDGNDSVE
jgi:hypothetical protein